MICFLASRALYYISTEVILLLGTGILATVFELLLDLVRLLQSRIETRISSLLGFVKIDCCVMEFKVSEFLCMTRTSIVWAIH